MCAPHSSPCRVSPYQASLISLAYWFTEQRLPGPRLSPYGSCCGWEPSIAVSHRLCVCNCAFYVFGVYFQFKASVTLSLTSLSYSLLHLLFISFSFLFFCVCVHYMASPVTQTFLSPFSVYPCPLYSVRFRKALFGQTGHTIMKLLVVSDIPVITLFKRGSSTPISRKTRIFI